MDGMADGRYSHEPMDTVVVEPPCSANGGGPAAASSELYAWLDIEPPQYPPPTIPLPPLPSEMRQPPAGGAGPSRSRAGPLYSPMPQRVIEAPSFI